MKKIFVIILILMLSILLLSSCIFSLFKTHPPCVTQSLENVASIELLDTADYKENVLYTLTEDEFETFWVQFMTLEFARLINDPPTDFGNLSVRITYADGSVDFIGMRINVSHKPNGESIRTGWYSLVADNYKALYALFSQYVDESLLPATRQ